MRKLSSVFTVIMLTLSLAVCAEAKEADKSDYLRVGISYSTDAKSEAWFNSAGEIYITDEYGDTVAVFNSDEKIGIFAEEGFLTNESFRPEEGKLTVSSDDIIYYNNTPYRGSFELLNKDGRINVINIVSEDDYLASLLGKEMSTSWPIEALKAQAVCARNYARTISGKHKSDGFDICATQHCQVYGGTKSEAESTRRAVRETNGVTVEYDGKVVPLYYFSCDGGYTEDSENVWVNALGYLRGKKDIHENPKYATRYNWSVTYTKEEIENILNSKGMGVGELLDVRIDEMSENNGVLKLTFIGDEKEKTVSKTQTRTVLSLNSQAYEIEKKSSAPVLREETEVLEYNVLTENGVVRVENPVYVITGDGVEKMEYDTVEVRDEKDGYDSYTFNGHGWGHLVGMSQWGAYSMALDGYSYEDILNFYFTDIDIVKEKVLEEDDEMQEEETHWSDTGI